VTAVFEEPPESEGGGSMAYADELPAALSEGGTLEEAGRNLRYALEESLPSMKSSTGSKLTLLSSTGQPRDQKSERPAQPAYYQ